MGLHLMDKVQDSCSQIQAAFYVFSTFSTPLLIHLVLYALQNLRCFDAGVFWSLSGTKVVAKSWSTREMQKRSPLT